MHAPTEPASPSPRHAVGVVLLNIGTPDAPTTEAVRRYLGEFLGDPRVLDMPAPARWALLHAAILPFRSPKSAALYRTIWGTEGSPLLVHTRALAAKLRDRLPGVSVMVGMRYGNPGFAAALDVLRDEGATHVVLAPLFPQHASASTGSALEAAYRHVATWPRVPELSVLPAFFADPTFIDAVANTIEEALGAEPFDHLLFSYHSVPLRQVQRLHPTCQGNADCCSQLDARNASCYRAQCVATSAALVQRLGLAGRLAHSTSFQSRLGRAEWLGPATEAEIASLAKSGVRRLGVVCPSFVADCLETLEEIGVRAKEQFLGLGGESLAAIPCVNARDDFTEALAGLLRPLLLPTAGTACSP